MHSETLNLHLHKKFEIDALFHPVFFPDRPDIPNWTGDHTYVL